MKDKYTGYFDDSLRQDWKTESLGALKNYLHGLMLKRFSVDKRKAYIWLYKTTKRYHVADLDRQQLTKAIKEIRR